MSEKSKVYFADFRCPSWRENLPQKLARLIMTAGFPQFPRQKLGVLHGFLCGILRTALI